MGPSSFTHRQRKISLYFEKVQDTAVIVTMEDESELLCDMLNGKVVL